MADSTDVVQLPLAQTPPGTGEEMQWETITPEIALPWNRSASGAGSQDSP